ncbi:hypothetical protein ACLBWT_08765 [Paenibacillus sp. D51F]
MIGKLFRRYEGWNDRWWQDLNDTYKRYKKEHRKMIRNNRQGNEEMVQAGHFYRFWLGERELKPGQRFWTRFLFDWHFSRMEWIEARISFPFFTVMTLLVAAVLGIVLLFVI